MVVGGTWVALARCVMLRRFGWFVRAARKLGGVVAIGLLCRALSSRAFAQEEDLAPRPRPLSPEEARRVEDLRQEAGTTLQHGQFDRARREFEEILKLAPGDASAERDAARAAQAAGDFEYSARALEDAHHFERHKPDPELHYLRGEALYVLGRKDEARREHRIAELEIGPAPRDRLSKLWLARIYARRGYFVLADRLYDSLWPAAPKFDTEVAVNQADAHLMNEDWDGAKRILRRYLDLDPSSARPREMLAWALEVTGELDGELATRQGLALDAPTGAHHLDYGRALERAADYPDARDQYEGALAASAGKDPDATVMTFADRMRYRMTPELAGGFSGRSDPQAIALRLQAGASLPFGRRQGLSLVGWRDESSGGFPSARGSVTGFGAWLLLAERSGASLIAGGDLRYSSASVGDNGVVFSDRQTFKAGAFGEVDTPLWSFAQINVHGDLDEQWNESPITVQEGGTTSGATGHLFLFPRNRRFLLDAGAQLRTLALAPRVGDEAPRANQALLFIGADVVLWSNPTRILRGEILDERLLRRTYLSDAGILSYRHYELFTDAEPDFSARIAIAPRAAIHNGTMVIRKVFAGGRAGIDLRGGGGYDTERQHVLAQGGASLLIAPSWSSRISLSYDFARETATGLEGTLQTGWLTYHADL